jgi:hypothetical protein
MRREAERGRSRRAETESRDREPSALDRFGSGSARLGSELRDSCSVAARWRWGSAGRQEVNVNGVKALQDLINVNALTLMVG